MPGQSNFVGVAGRCHIFKELYYVITSTDPKVVTSPSVRILVSPVTRPTPSSTLPPTSPTVPATRFSSMAVTPDYNIHGANSPEQGKVPINGSSSPATMVTGFAPGRAVLLVRLRSGGEWVAEGSALP